MQDLIGPDIRNSVFAHIIHVLLIGGVIVYGWQAVTALVRTPTSAGRAVRKAVNAAWLAVLFLLLTRENPAPYLGAAGVIAGVLLVFKLLDRLAAPAKQKELHRI
jgi:TRAP-type C4-dicarboxylate transport system permease small subunit